MRYFILLAALLLASPVMAQTWHAQPSTGNEVPGLRPYPAGPVVAYYENSGTTDSRLLDISACETVDIIFVSNTASSTAIDGATVNIMIQVGGIGNRTANANVSYQQCQDINGGGVDCTESTLNGDNGSTTDQGAHMFGVTGPLLWVDPQANGDNETFRVAVKCNGA